MAHLFVLEDSKRHILVCGQQGAAPLTSPCSVVYLLIQIHYISYHRGRRGNSLSLNFCALSTAKGMKLSMNKKQIIFIGGKGGVGKSTTSAATAIHLSEQGLNTLLVSTDPAHNTSDIFHIPQSSDILEISKNLSMIEVDFELEGLKYIQSVKENLRPLVKATMLAEVYRQIDLAGSSPGASEAALFDKLTSIILEEFDRYDVLVFDTAPTGHTLRLLTLPELMGVWVDGLIEKRKKIQENYSQLLYDGEINEDPIYEILQKRKQKFMKVRNLLANKDITKYWMVLNAERLSILETYKAVQTLKDHGMHVSRLIVNKIIPDQADGKFLEKRKQSEKAYLHEIDEKFGDLNTIHMPLFETDINSVELLKLFASQLFLTGIIV